MAGGAANNADAYVWIGGADGLWDDAADWADSTGGLTQAVASPGTLTPVLVTATAPTVIEGGGAAASLDVTGTVALAGSYGIGAVAAGVLVAASHAAPFASEIAGWLSVGAGATLNAGSVAVPDGGVAVDAGGSLAVAGLADITQGTLAIDGGAAAVGSLTIGDGLAGASQTPGTLALTKGGALTVFDAITEMAGVIAVDGALARLVDQGWLTLDAAGSLFAPSLGASGGGLVQVGGIVVGAGATGGAALVVDPASAIEVGFAGGAALGAITVDLGAGIATDRSVELSGNLVDNGAVGLNAGTFTVAGAIGGGGEVLIGAGATLAAGDGIGAGVTVQFAGTDATLVLQPTADMLGAITGFAESDLIVLTGVAASGAVWNNGVLTISAGSSQVVSLAVAAPLDGATFFVSPAIGGSAISWLRLGGAAGDVANNADAMGWVGDSGGAWNTAADWQDGTTGANPALAFPGLPNPVTIAGGSEDVYEVVTGGGNAAGLTITGLVCLGGTYEVGGLTLGVQSLLTAAGVTSAALAAGSLLLDPGSQVFADSLALPDGSLLLDGGKLSDAGALTIGLPAGFVVPAGTSEVYAPGSSGLVQVGGGGSLAVLGATDLLQGTLAVNDAAVSLAGLTLGGVGTSGAISVSDGGALTTGSISVDDGDIAVDGFGSRLVARGMLALGVAASAANARLSAADSALVQIGGILLAGSGTASLQADAGAAIEVGFAGGAALGAVTVDAGSMLSAEGSAALDADLVDNGQVVIAAGTLAIAGALAGSGTVSVGAGAALTVGGGIGSGMTVSFDGAAATLVLTAAGEAGTIAGFAAQDIIVLQGVSATGATWNAGVLSVFDGVSVVGTLDLVGNYSSGTFAATASGGGVSLSFLPGAAIVPADFSGGGKSAILWQNVDGAPAIWLVNGLLPTATQQLANPGAAWHVVTTGNFTDDPYSDILWQNDDGMVAVWQIDGVTPVAYGEVANPGSAWHVLATGDFNGDGNSDILFQNDNGAPAIWEMRGTSIIASAQLANPGTAWHVVGTGDFNGDGCSDILWQGDDGMVAIWEMDGLSPIATGDVANPGTAWRVAGTGDFNGDGRSDILFQNDDGTVAIWEIDGTSILASAELGNPGSAWHVVGTGDYNGDGRADILFQNDNGTVAIWEMDGLTPIATGQVANVPLSWQTIGSGSTHFINGTRSAGEIAATILDDDFTFTSSLAGLHVIAGFDPVHDVITLSAARFAGFGGLAPYESVSNGAMMLDLGSGSTLALQGIGPGALAGRNFIFG